MKNKSLIGVLRYGVAGLFLFLQAGHAQSLQTPDQVVNSYLASLVNGNAAQLASLIGGAKKRDNPQITLDPEYYGQFLQKHYRDAVATVEEMSPDGESWKARVRIDFPTGGSQTTTLIVRLVDGEWKVTDEKVQGL